MLTILFWIGVIPGAIFTLLVGQIPCIKREFDTGNDSSMTVLGLSSIFFGYFISAWIIFFVIYGIVSLFF